MNSCFFLRSVGTQRVFVEGLIYNQSIHLTSPTRVLKHSHQPPVFLKNHIKLPSHYNISFEILQTAQIVADRKFSIPPSTYRWCEQKISLVT